MKFSWDENKAASNSRDHRVLFGEAATVFLDPLSMTISDELHSLDERRFITLGTSDEGRLLFVVYTYDEDGDEIHIIGAREATARERKDYEEEKNY